MTATEKTVCCHYSHHEVVCLEDRYGDTQRLGTRQRENGAACIVDYSGMTRQGRVGRLVIVH
jgi:hypothetical protein